MPDFSSLVKKPEETKFFRRSVTEARLLCVILNTCSAVHDRSRSLLSNKRISSCSRDVMYCLIKLLSPSESSFSITHCQFVPLLICNLVCLSSLGKGLSVLEW